MLYAVIDRETHRVVTLCDVEPQIMDPRYMVQEFVEQDLSDDCDWYDWDD